MPTADEIIDELRYAGFADAAEYVEQTSRDSEARRGMGRAALKSVESGTGEPVRAAFEWYEEWRTSPAEPGDLSSAHARAYARPARRPTG